MTTTCRFRGPRSLPLILSAACLTALTSFGTGCGGDDPDGRDRTDPALTASADDLVTTADGSATSADGSAASADGSISASGAWVRVAIRPAGSDESGAPPVNSAGYLVLQNSAAEHDALVTVETEVADTAELHSVSLDGGIMRMRPVDSIPVPAGGEAVLEPGGYHIMLIGLRNALAEGDSVALVLRLRSGAAVEVLAPVRRAGMM